MAAERISYSWGTPRENVWYESWYRISWIARGYRSKRGNDALLLSGLFLLHILISVVMEKRPLRVMPSHHFRLCSMARGENRNRIIMEIYAQHLILIS